MALCGSSGGDTAAATLIVTDWAHLGCSAHPPHRCSTPHLTYPISLTPSIAVTVSMSKQTHLCPITRSDGLHEQAGPSFLTIAVTVSMSKQAPIVGRINMVDLAGSERIKKSHSEGQRFKEAVHINTSLSALAKVVLALSQLPEKPDIHVPYR